MDKQALKKLKDSLPHGAIKAIADELGITIYIVRGALTGANQNLKVLEKAVNYMEGIKTKSGELNERLKTLVA